MPLAERRQRLEALLDAIGKPLMASASIDAESWEDLAEIRSESRARRVEGLMLKRKTSACGTDRQQGDWWKWKVDPLSLDAVLIYAQAGSGRRANLFTDYTFAVWRGEDLVPIAKAYFGLSDKEMCARSSRAMRSNWRSRVSMSRPAINPAWRFAFPGSPAGAPTRSQ